MSDEYNPAPHQWSLEEIDELLRDSGVTVLFDEEESAGETLPPKAESVDPRSTRIDKTKHFVIPGAVENSGSDQDTAVFSGLESDKYRNRFLNTKNCKDSIEENKLKMKEAYLKAKNLRKML